MPDDHAVAHICVLLLARPVAALIRCSIGMANMTRGSLGMANSGIVVSGRSHDPARQGE